MGFCVATRGSTILRAKSVTLGSLLASKRYIYSTFPLYKKKGGGKI